MSLCKFALLAATVFSAFALPIAANAQGAEYPITSSYMAPGTKMTLSLPAVTAPTCCQPRHALSAIWDWSIVSNLAVVPRRPFDTAVAPRRIPVDNVGIVRTIAGPQLSNIPVF